MLQFLFFFDSWGRRRRKKKETIKICESIDFYNHTSNKSTSDEWKDGKDGNKIIFVHAFNVLMQVPKRLETSLDCYEPKQILNAFSWHIIE